MKKIYFLVFTILYNSMCYCMINYFEGFKNALAAKEALSLVKTYSGEAGSVLLLSGIILDGLKENSTKSQITKNLLISVGTAGLISTVYCLSNENTRESFSNFFKIELLKRKQKSLKKKNTKMIENIINDKKKVEDLDKEVDEAILTSEKKFQQKNIQTGTTTTISIENLQKEKKFVVFMNTVVENTNSYNKLLENKGIFDNSFQNWTSFESLADELNILKKTGEAGNQQNQLQLQNIPNQINQISQQIQIQKIQTNFFIQKQQIDDENVREENIEDSFFSQKSNSQIEKNFKEIEELKKKLLK